MAKYSGTDRIQLTRQLERAQARGEEDMAARLQTRLDNMETPRLAFRTSLHQQKRGGGGGGGVGDKSSQDSPMQLQERLALVNAENRRRNAESVREALIRTQERARELQVKKKLAAKAASDAKSARPVAGANSDGKRNGGGATAPPPLASDVGAKKNGIVVAVKKQTPPDASKLPLTRRPAMDDHMIEELDLGIDIDV